MSDILVILIVVSFGVSIFMWIQTFSKLIMCNQKTTGTIVGVTGNVEWDFKVRRMIYSPVVTYEVNGKVYTAVGKQFSKYEEMFTKGSECKVRYNSVNPAVSIVNGRTGTGFIGGFFLILGIVFLFLSRY